jgi:hypothetical protein
MKKKLEKYVTENYEANGEKKNYLVSNHDIHFDS